MQQSQRGLTLVELMVTLAVAIILIASGMPLFTGVAANNRATAQSNSLLAAIRLARSEAVKRSTDVFVCPVSDPSAASPSCTGNDDDWHLGWTVYYLDSSSTARHIRTWGAPPGDPTIDSNSSTSINFRPTGSASAVTNVALSQDDAEGIQSRCIAVNKGGQIRMKRYDPDKGETCP